jgi:anti-sigma factor RsiW
LWLSAHRRETTALLERHDAAEAGNARGIRQQRAVRQAAHHDVIDGAPARGRTLVTKIEQALN